MIYCNCKNDVFVKKTFYWVYWNVESKNQKGKLYFHPGTTGRNQRFCPGPSGTMIMFFSHHFGLSKLLTFLRLRIGSPLHLLVFAPVLPVQHLGLEWASKHHLCGYMRWCWRCCFKSMSCLETEFRDTFLKRKETLGKCWNDSSDFWLEHVEHRHEMIQTIHRLGINIVSIQFQSIYSTWVNIFNNLKHLRMDHLTHFKRI